MGQLPNPPGIDQHSQAWFVGAVCLFLGTTWFLWSPPIQAIKSARISPTTGGQDRPEVQFVKGPVHYRKPDLKNWNRIEDTGVQLPEKAEIKVGDGAAVAIKPADTGSVKLNEQTGVTLDRSKGSTLNLELEYGSAKLDVPNKSNRLDTIQLKTPHGVAGVRGTEFGGSYERKNRSEVHVTEGKVSLRANKDRVTVSSGRFAAFGSGTNKGGILTRGPLQKRHRMVWNYWKGKKKVYTLKQKRSDMQSTLNSLKEKLSGDGLGGLFGELTGVKEKIDQASQQLERINQRISRVESRYRDTFRNYREYRQRLERKRGQFLKRRKRTFKRE